MSDLHVLAAAKLSPLYTSQLSAAFQFHDRLHETDPAAFAQVAPRVRAVAGSGDSKGSAQPNARLPGSELSSGRGGGSGRAAHAAPGGERRARPRTREAYAAWLGQRTATGAAPEPAAGPVTESAARPGGPPFDERVLVGLRRREGVRLPALARQAGIPADALAALQERWRPFLDAGLLIREGPRWRLSDPQGLALSNAVLRELLQWWEPLQLDPAGHPPSP